MTVVLEPGPFEKAVLGSLVKSAYFRGRRGRMWPTPPGARAFTFRGGGRSRLAALHHAAPHPQGIAVLVHPDRRYGKHWFVRDGWFEALAKAGIDSLAFDFPMYGGSRGSPYLHEHVAAAVAEARRLRPGLPVHLVGLSLGAFASINAACRLDGLASVSLESPYPTFTDWMHERRARGWETGLDRGLRRVWPKTYARIDAGANVAGLRAPRILIGAATRDPVTPVGLTRMVARNAPAHAHYIEVGRDDHLGLFREPDFRQAMLEAMGVAMEESSSAGVP